MNRFDELIRHVSRSDCTGREDKGQYAWVWVSKNSLAALTRCLPSKERTPSVDFGHDTSAHGPPVILRMEVLKWGGQYSNVYARGCSNDP